jgi:SAM-dependent methyltransferase
LGDELGARYPGVRYVRIAAGAPLPFADGAFDVAHSNAVLEHVGGPDARRAFVRELLRVGRRLFLTVPNRWFPVEHHTALPLLHFHPPLFRAACRRLGRASWADPSELDFLDRGLLRREWPADRPVRIVMAGLPLGPFSSNIAVIA